jgi:acyl-CoA synthetase (AMP-forming)/AMP-acid ligase II
MTFAAVLHDIANATHSQHNTVTDGQTTVFYHELPALLAAIDYALRAQDITPDHCLALECNNSLPAALTLLCLLQQGYRIMLLPPTDKKEALAALKPLPTFCRYRVTLAPAVDTAHSGNGWHPEEALTIQANAHYQPEPPAPEPHSAKLYLRTSGSMGNAKIVRHAHARLLDNARNCVQRFQLTADDRVTLAVPIFHMYGLGAGFLPAVLAGASIDLQENTNLVKYLDRERRFKPNAAFLTPALCDMLLKRRGGSRVYKVAVSAGARLKEEIVRAFDERFGALVNLYGSTELGAISVAAPDADLEVRATTIGWPMANVTLAPAARVKVLEAGEPPATQPAVATPVTDELYCQHPYGFEAYLDEYGHVISAAATWFQTGDLAKFSPDGMVHILGRTDNSINRDGYLVLLTDVERAMEALEAVAQVVALTTSTEQQRGQYLAAFCVLKEGFNLDSSHIRSQCFDILPRYAIPDEVFVLDTLPRLPSGKADRQALIAHVTVANV